MPVSVRLKRMGNRNRAFFRVVAADGRTATTSRAVEELGWYDPRVDGVNFKLDLSRVDYWEENGAQFSSTVKNLVKRARSLPPTEEEAPVAAPAAEEPAAVDAEAPAEAEAPTEAEVEEAPAQAEKPTDQE